MFKNDKETWNSVVSKLAAQTKAGELQWETNPLNQDMRANVVGQVYRAQVLGKLVRVYEYEYEYYDDDANNVPAQEVSIEFVTPDGQRMWELPHTDSRFELLNAIRYRSAGIEDFLTKYLKAS